MYSDTGSVAVPYAPFPVFANKLHAVHVFNCMNEAQERISVNCRPVHTKNGPSPVSLDASCHHALTCSRCAGILLVTTEPNIRGAHQFGDNMLALRPRGIYKYVLMLPVIWVQH